MMQTRKAEVKAVKSERIKLPARERFVEKGQRANRTWAKLPVIAQRLRVVGFTPTQNQIDILLSAFDRRSEKTRELIRDLGIPKTVSAKSVEPLDL